MEPDPSLNTLIATCEREQLHLSGQIQPFGALLQVDRETGIVTHVSANVAEFLPFAAIDLLGQPAPPLLTPLLEAPPSTQGHTLIKEWVAAGLSRSLDARLTGCSRFLLIECEPTTGHGESRRNFRKSQIPLLVSPTNTDELITYHQNLVNAIRETIQFDRVMVYRFLEDWSGEVIAESTRTDLGISYRGLRFPASDIPAVARRLYQLNPYRMIPDANAAPIPILSQDGAPPDLSVSDLRSVSPVHVMYLNHLSAVASFSVSILISGRLWGLVACHHAKPAFLSLQDREACAHLVHYYGLGIASFDTSRRLRLLDSFPRKIEQAIGEIASSHDVQNQHGKLLELLAADGIVLGLGEELLAFGETPQSALMARIDRWFMNDWSGNLFTTDHLQELKGDIGEMAANPSGMLAIKVKSPQSGWIRFFWFRNELLHQVSWAGNPHKSVVADPTAQRLSPRRSFDQWIEEKTGYSRPWTREDRVISGMLRISLLRWL
jgi:light-regulated signal transduction histidine kinase (bacteriophytochrome)